MQENHGKQKVTEIVSSLAPTGRSTGLVIRDATGQLKACHVEVQEFQSGSGNNKIIYGTASLGNSTGSWLNGLVIRDQGDQVVVLPDLPPV